MEPPRTPWAPTEPNAWGDAPAARATTRKGRKSSAKTRRERGDDADGIDKRDRRKKKTRRARSRHSKRASARPSAKADKDSTKKERRMERVSDSYWVSNRGTYARQVSDPGKGRTLVRAQNSQSLAAAGRTTRKHAGIYRCEEKPQTEGRSPSRRI